MTRWSVFSSRAWMTRTVHALSSTGIDAEAFGFRTLSDLRDGVAAAATDRLAIVGNDRTVSEAVDSLLQHRSQDDSPVLGVLPARGGCEFARMFGLPQTLEEAVHHLDGDETYLCDVGMVEGSWGRRFFLNVATGGTIFSGRSGRTEIRLVTDRRTYEGPATGVLMANGQFGKGGKRVAPRATVTDGRLDVQTWNVPRRDRSLFLREVAVGAHLTDKRVRSVTTGSFDLSTERPWRVEADGTMLGTTPLSGRVRPAAIALKI